MNKRLFILLSIVISTSLVITLFLGRNGTTTNTGKSSPLKLSSSSFYENMRITKESPIYKVNPNPSCFLSGCNLPNNYRALRSCKNDQSTQWNRMGVKSLNRWMNLYSSEYNDNSFLSRENNETIAMSEKDLLSYNSDYMLDDALYSFLNATALDPGCPQVIFNLAATFMIKGQHMESYQLFNYTTQLFEDETDKSISNLFMGINFELMGRLDGAALHYNKMMDLKEGDTTDLDYFGISFRNNKDLTVNRYGAGEDSETMRDYAIFKYFSDVSVSEYGLVNPGTQDTFIENRYIVLKRILHPFILRTASKCYRKMINAGVLKFGDGQSQRYSAYNDRCARFLHYHLTDFIRKVIAHNAKPSYTYFGGYKGGSELKPHLDRAQCEYTMSLTLDQYPKDETWLLSLRKIPVTKDTKFVIPPEEEIADADLKLGDALLFMGRTLLHFRRGPLREGAKVHQVFLHYVQEDFEGPLN